MRLKPDLKISSMNNITNEVTNKQWLDVIAEKTSYSKKDIQKFLTNYNITQSPSIGNPRRIQLVDIEFSGTKKGNLENDFKFVFNDLGPGLYGLFTDKNLRGKSTAIEIIKWLIKGKSSESFQSGVKSWVKDASLKLKVDNDYFVIRVNQDEDFVSGQIERSLDGEIFNAYKEFSGEEDMANKISDFMMNILDLEKVSSFRQNSDELEVGSEISHGWPALASAMFIGTTYNAIFGDLTLSGLPNRILNMYLGLPWIPTHAALKAVQIQFKNQGTVDERKVDTISKSRAIRLKQIQQELKGKQKELRTLKAPTTNNNRLQELLDEFNDLYGRQKEYERRLLDFTLNFDNTQNLYIKDKQALNYFKENKAATKIFKQLNPTCCPHCEQKITSEQIEKEKKENKCSVCDKTMLESEDLEDYFQELRKAAEASETAFKEGKKEQKVREKALNDVSKFLANKKLELDNYKQKIADEKISTNRYVSLKNDIERLEILEKEYESSETILTTDLEENKSIAASSDIDEEKILKEAIKETELRFRNLQEDLLIDVNKKILEYCPKVGLNQYKNIVLNSQPSLKIFKDGGDTTFSKVSKGEQLRLKVLATVALISIAEKRKLGRHPGFILIDSPAAQEVNKEDLSNLIIGIKEMCNDIPHLQVIVASTANDTILTHIPDNRRKYAKGDDYLW